MGPVVFIFAGAFTTFCSKYKPETSLCESSFIYGFNVFCAAFLGVGCSFLWICQGIYVDACADEKTKGLFNGIFWSIFQSSQILSSTLATFILGSTDQFTFYSILMVFAIFAIGMLTFVRPPVERNTNTQVNTANETLGEAVKKLFEAMGEKQYFFLFIPIFFSGVAIACYINFLGAAIVSTIDSTNVNVINQSIGYVFMVLAVGEVAAGLSMGRLADTYNKISLMNITIVINEGALLFTLLACVFKSYACTLVAALLWGYGDTSIQTMINAVIGSMFGGKVELFSAYRFFQSTGFMYSTIFCILVPPTNPVTYVLIIAGSMLALHTLFYKYIPADDKSQDYKLLDEKLLTEMKVLKLSA
jgi:hypothetical protein